MIKIDLDTAALEKEVRDWDQNEVKSFLGKQREKRDQFYPSGGFPVKRVYTALDVKDTPLDDVGRPGRFPFTRGPYPTMYRSRNWTMRQIAGFGTGEDTNKRFKYLISQGQTGLSVDFDMPTLMGYDSDHPMSDGEVGREGVAVDTQKSTRLNSSHSQISYAVFCLKKKKPAGRNPACVVPGFFYRLLISSTLRPRRTVS